MTSATIQPIFFPKLLSTLRVYSWKALAGDAAAGAVVGIVALPLAIAFAIASGVSPERGLTTAIVAGFLISLLGGSRVQIGGPTGAFVVIVYHIVERYGVPGLLASTCLAGAMLIGMGVLRLGTVIRFIPYPLIVGFTSGIAVVIFSSQIKDLLGLQLGALPADLIDTWRCYVESIQTLNPAAAALSAASLAILWIWPRVTRRIPGSIAALILATAAAHWLQLPVETIGSRFGDLPSALPAPRWPALSMDQWRWLVGPAATIAVLGAIESLLSATVADGMIEGRHRSNTELVAQGIANLVTPLFGGLPATGAIARTATNVKHGGRTPVAGMIHAVVLLLIVLLFGRWARLIPLCALAAILVTVAWQMSEWHAFRALLRAPRMDVAVLFTTFLLTVLAGLTVAVEVGLVMSSLLFMLRMTDATSIRQVSQEMRAAISEEQFRGQADAASRRRIPDGVEVYELEGAFFFGVAELFRDHFPLGRPPKVLILRMRHTLVLDATGIRALDDLRRRGRALGTTLVIQGLHAQPLAALDRAELLESFGPDNVVATLDEALERARALLSGPSCYNRPRP